jgi:hypothetical protein
VELQLYCQTDRDGSRIARAGNFNLLDERWAQHPRSLVCPAPKPATVRKTITACIPQAKRRPIGCVPTTRVEGCVCDKTPERCTAVYRASDPPPSCLKCRSVLICCHLWSMFLLSAVVSALWCLLCSLLLLSVGVFELCCLPWSMLSLSDVVSTPVVCCGLYSCCLLWSVLLLSAVVCALCHLLWSMLSLSVVVSTPAVYLGVCSCCLAVVSARAVCCALCSSCLLPSLLLLSAVVYALVVLLWSLLLLSCRGLCSCCLAVVSARAVCCDTNRQVQSPNAQIQRHIKRYS